MSFYYVLLHLIYINYLLLMHSTMYETIVLFLSATIIIIFKQSAEMT